MTTAFAALGVIPSGLRDPLLAEYREITRNYAEHRWRPSELSGGIFCEIVYTILHGYAAGAYPSTPSKPPNFPNACKLLENGSTTAVPHSFRILIPRALPALYDIRNNRSVGHAGGDVDSNHMDATLVLAMANWIMAELVRVLHNLPIREAQTLVDALADRRIPLVWEGVNMRRVLDPKMKLGEQFIILIASKSGTVNVADLLDWTGYKNKSYFMKMLREFHDKRRLLTPRLAFQPSSTRERLRRPSLNPSPARGGGTLPYHWHAKHSS